MNNIITPQKIVSGLLTPTLLLIAVSWGDFQLLWHLKVLFITVIGLIATLFQPAYSPFKNRTQDKGTALQILWTVFATQTLALLEAFYRNYPLSMSLDAISYLWLSCAVIGLFLRSWAFLKLNQSFTWFVQVNPNQTVVTDGPYHYLAHPSYTGALITYVSIPLFLKSNITAGVALVLLGLAFYRRISLEETELTLVLGEDYTNFKQQRRKLIPFVW